LSNGGESVIVFDKLWGVMKALEDIAEYVPDE
jgi:hypothetical protein